MQRWLEDELIIVAAPDASAGARAPQRTRQLTDATWILREPASGTRQAADAWLLEHLGTLQVQYELGSTEAIKRLAAAGAGLACVSRHAVAAELAQGSAGGAAHAGCRARGGGWRSRCGATGGWGGRRRISCGIAWAEPGPRRHGGDALQRVRSRDRRRRSHAAVKTPSATDASRAIAESAREVSTIGTLAPSTRPAQSPPPT